MHQSLVGDLYDRVVDYYGDKTAIIEGVNYVTYHQLGERANYLARGLQEQGIGKSECVAFLMANCKEYIYCEYAMAKIGAIRVPLAVLLSPNDHIYMMNEAECTTLVYHYSMTERVQKMIPALLTVTRFICVGLAEQMPKGHLRLSDLMAKKDKSADPVVIDGEELAGIYFTGGTTGRPKGVMLSHRSWFYTYVMEIIGFGIGQHEKFIFTTPLTHAGGCLILPVLLGGGCCVIIDHFDPVLFMETVEREQVTMTFLVPTMIYALLDHPDLLNYDLRSLHNIIYGAAAIAPDRLKQALQTFGPVMTQLFGQTEAPMAISALSREDHFAQDPDRAKQILSSAGRPTLHTEIRFLDDNGQDVEKGQPGEVVVRSPNMMSGYLKNPEITAETIKDDWLYTGDVAWQDHEGFIYIVDRKKDMIISGGFNIYPREIEDVLHDHPAVQNVAVVGLPHDKWGEEVCAVVTLHDRHQVTESELIEYVKDNKGSLMAPKKVKFWKQIPLTNLGKLDKKAMVIKLTAL